MFRRAFLAAAAAAPLLPLAGRAAMAGMFESQAPVAADLSAVRLVGRDGTRHTLDDVLPSGPAIVHLWATWCGPCVAELPEIADFTAGLMPPKLARRVVLISLDRGPRPAVDRFLATRVRLPDLATWQDPDGTASTVFRVLGFPTTVLLDPGHAVVAREEGSMDWTNPDIRDALIRHLSTDDITSQPA